MKFCYYSKKKADDVRFFTIQTDSDNEMLRINTVSEEFGIKLIPEACSKYGFEYCYAVVDENITNIQLARERYSQIKEAVENLSEDKIIQRYYFTDEDGNEIWEDFCTLKEAHIVAKELANKHHQDICINTVIDEAIVDYESPDEEIETTELCPNCETEVTVKTDKNNGYKTVCPLCHKKLMLCSICRSSHNGCCEYNTATDSCRFDSS